MQKMSDKIDVSRIMKELEEKLKNGLNDRKLNITDISLLIGEHLERAKEKVLKDVSELIKEELGPDDNERCKDCEGHLKKTEKETNP